MKNTISVCLLLFLAFAASAQDSLTLFNEYSQNGDTVKQLELLDLWEQESPNDAELITCYFNFYFNKSKHEILSVNGGEPPHDEEVIVLRDSLGEIAGFIGSFIDYEQSNLKQAFEHIDQGIDLYPDRLDMRFGKIYAIGQIKDWDSFTKEIIKTVDYSAVNKNQWTWTYSKAWEGGEEGFLQSLQDYQYQLYQTMEDELLVNMRDISVSVLKHYPNHVESLSNISVSYLVEGEYEKALEPLLKAEQIRPEDVVVLFNIAYAYKENGNNEKAISYYEKIILYGDEQAKSQARLEIDNIKDNGS